MPLLRAESGEKEAEVGLEATKDGCTPSPWRRVGKNHFVGLSIHEPSQRRKSPFVVFCCFKLGSFGVQNVAKKPTVPLSSTKSALLTLLALFHLPPFFLFVSFPLHSRGPLGKQCLGGSRCGRAVPALSGRKCGTLCLL